MPHQPSFILFATLGMFFFCSSYVLSYHQSPLVEAGPTINVDSLFHYTASRNQKVISQAVDFVLAMQTAPTCTRMAASHLMNECKLLEHAPEFAKSRPEAYLDNVKTEYAAKLAVCELLSAQPNNPIPPPYCEILVPSRQACGKGLSWWHSKPEVQNDKQCYPELKDHLYSQCLKSLQSTPQFWTSFSNARQNAVVMCQASRDAVERESHLETYKNLTQMLGMVASTMHQTTKDYESFIHQQRLFTEEARDSQLRLKEGINAVQEKAIATVEILDQKLHAFMQASISELVTALTSSQSTEIAQLHQRMRNFSQNLMVENSQLASMYASELEQMQQRSLVTLQAHHDAQIDSYIILSKHADGVHFTVNQTSNLADLTLAKTDSMVRRLTSLESQTENIAEGFVFLSAIPALMARLIHGFITFVSVVFLFTVLCKIDNKLASYVAGTCSWIYLLRSSGLPSWVRELPSNISISQLEGADIGHSQFWLAPHNIHIVALLWLGSYPIYYINQFLGRTIFAIVNCVLGFLHIRQYDSGGGQDLLPSIEIPLDASSNESAPLTV